MLLGLIDTLELQEGYIFRLVKSTGISFSALSSLLNSSIFFSTLFWRTRWVGGLVGTDIRGRGLICNMRGGTYCCSNGWCKNSGGK